MKWSTVDSKKQYDCAIQSTAAIDLVHKATTVDIQACLSNTAHLHTTIMSDDAPLLVEIDDNNEDPSIANVKVPITIVTGYLGSGKSTLLNHVASQKEKKIAIIVNEFGSCKYLYCKIWLFLTSIGYRTLANRAKW